MDPGAYRWVFTENNAIEYILWKLFHCYCLALFFALTHACSRSRNAMTTAARLYYWHLSCRVFDCFASEYILLASWLAKYSRWVHLQSTEVWILKYYELKLLLKYMRIIEFNVARFFCSFLLFILFLWNITPFGNKPLLLYILK